jgi:hypothetical protein
MIASLVEDKSIHSSVVRLAVEVQGQEYPVCAVGLDRFVLVAPIALLSESAHLIVTIDGHSRRSPIQIATHREPVREYMYARQKEE